MADLSFTLTGLSINSTFIPVTQGNADPTITPFLIGANGNRFVDFAGAGSVIPRQTFTSPALAVAIAVCSFAGLEIAAGVDMYFTQYDGIGTAAGNVHIKIAISDGIILLDSLSASETTEATANYTIYAISPDGSTAPMIITQNNAAPSTGVLSEVFFSGPVVIGGTTYETTAIDFQGNWQVGHVPTSGHTYPTRAQMEQGDPKFNITLADLSAATAITASGSAEDDTAIFFRAGAEGGDGRVADASLAHLKVSAAKAFVQCGPLDGSWGQAGSSSIIVHPRSNAGAAPVVITADLAMP